MNTSSSLDRQSIAGQLLRHLCESANITEIIVSTQGELNRLARTGGAPFMASDDGIHCFNTKLSIAIEIPPQNMPQPGPPGPITWAILKGLIAESEIQIGHTPSIESAIALAVAGVRPQRHDAGAEYLSRALIAADNVWQYAEASENERLSIAARKVSITLRELIEEINTQPEPEPEQ